jgi:hypothetical protein
MSYGGKRPYLGDYGVTSYPDPCGTSNFPALRLETIVSMGMGIKPDAAGDYCPLDAQNCRAPRSTVRGTTRRTFA